METYLSHAALTRLNPRVYTQPSFHKEGLNNLDFTSDSSLSREEIENYFEAVRKKIIAYDNSLTDDILLQKPGNCEWSHFELILAQHRHLHSHMGIIIGFVIEDTGMWPKTLGLERTIPEKQSGPCFF